MQKVYSSAYPSLKMSTRKEQTLLWPSILFGLFILLPTLSPAVETLFFISFLFFPITIWAFSKAKMPEVISRFAGLLLLIILIGLVNFTGHKVHDVARDIWILLNPALALTVGYILMQNMMDLKRLLRVFIIAATLLALLHLSKVAMHPEILHKSALDIRGAGGYGFYEPGIALALFLAARKMKLKIFGEHVWLSCTAIFLCSASFIVSFSRTLDVVLILIFLSVFGWINFYSRIKVIIFSLVIVAIIGIGFMFPASHGNGVHPEMSEKILNSFQEIKIKEYRDMREVGGHWRGFETAKALETFRNGTLPEYFVGRGMGALVDTHLFTPLGPINRFIPVMHNGYMYLLVKTGILGLCLYLLLFYRLVRVGTILDSSECISMKYCGRLLVGFSLAFLSSTYVMSGMYGGAMLSTTMLLGALLAYVSSPRNRS